MASEIRVNSLTNRSGLSTVSITDTGVVVAGMVTATDAIFTGDITATNGTFSGNVSVGGTLTYEDVTNIDSVGIITAQAGVKVPDSQKIFLGTDDDLQIFHDSSWNYIQSHNSKNFVIQVKDNENAFVAIPDGEVQLYHNNVKKLETTSSGVKVSGSFPDIIIHDTDTTNDNFRILHNGGGTQLLVDPNNVGPNASHFIVGIDGTERLRIKSDGKVGINQSTPQTTFHSTGTTNGQQATFGIDDSGLKISTFQKTDNDAGVILDAQQSSNGTLTFATAGTERLRINSAGNLGIGGLTNPGALLSIPAGESNTPRLAIESAVDDNDFTITQYEDGNGTYTMLGQNVKLNSGGNNTILDSAHRTAGILLDARNHGSIVFLTGGANAVGENLKIDDDGRVLVGPGAIATPKCGHAGIDIPNNDWAIIMGGSDGNGNRANNANKDGRFAGAHYVNAEEPVGIIRCTSGASANELHMGGGTSLVNAATQISLYTAANTTTTGGTERLRITSGGDVCVGGHSSNYANSPLEVRGTNAGGDVAIRVTNNSTASGTQAGIIFTTTTADYTTAGIGFERGTADALKFYVGQSAGGGGFTNATERLRIDSAGTIKCGTSATLKAEINSAIGGHQFISQCSDNNNGFEIYQQHGSTTTRNTFAVYANTGGGGSQELQFSVRGDGCVTKPKSPAFSANLAGGNLNAATHNNVVIFNNEHFDNGNNYNTSNGRFTAPIAGTYYFGVQIYAGFDITGVRVLHAKFQKNGSDVSSTDMFGGASNHGGTSYHPTGCGHMLIDLAVNDWVAFNSGGFSGSGSGNAIIYAASGTRFFGYLIG